MFADTSARTTPISRTFPGRSGWRKLASSVVLAIVALLSGGTAFATPVPATPGPATPARHGPTLESCQQEVFCAWEVEQYHGALHRVDPRTAPLERCLALPVGLEASSFVNHTGHPVTVYQDGHCATQADFQTYPSGTFVPKAPYVARAVKVWRH